MRYEISISQKPALRFSFEWNSLLWQEFCWSLFSSLCFFPMMMIAKQKSWNSIKSVGTLNLSFFQQKKKQWKRMRVFHPKKSHLPLWWEGESRNFWPPPTSKFKARCGISASQKQEFLFVFDPSSTLWSVMRSAVFPREEGACCFPNRRRMFEPTNEICCFFIRLKEDLFQWSVHWLNWSFQWFTQWTCEGSVNIWPRKNPFLKSTKSVMCSLIKVKVHWFWRLEQKKIASLNTSLKKMIVHWFWLFMKSKFISLNHSLIKMKVQWIWPWTEYLVCHRSVHWNFTDVHTRWTFTYLGEPSPKYGVHVRMG